jgi:hypothetical protein
MIRTGQGFEKEQSLGTLLLRMSAVNRSELSSQPVIQQRTLLYLRNSPSNPTVAACLAPKPFFCEITWIAQRRIRGSRQFVAAQ